jgi:hypothetical protein
MSNKIDAGRIKGTSPERLSKWFSNLERVIEEYNILPHNIYNMDESGFSIGEIEASKCIINAHIRQKFQAKWGRQEWVTSIECICADGIAISLLIIFKAKSLSRAWIPASVHESWAFSYNAKGWTSNQHGFEWLRRCFEPATREKADGQYRLLICDGHDSHITGTWIGYCMDNNIVLMILPPHSSHRTQPLDVGVFGPLKRHMASRLEPLLQTRIARLEKAEWAGAFVGAHGDAFTEKNIKAGFSATGIHPFRPSKVLRQAPSVTPEPTETRLPTPVTTTPFPDTVLTSSPADINAVNVANIALNTMLESGEPITTPGRKYFNCLVRTSNRLRAAKAILEKEKEALEGVVTSRRRRLSGKRKAIGDESLLTTVKMLNDIRSAEEMTKERGHKKQKVANKGRHKASIESSDESEVQSEGEGYEEFELLDCIEVKI